jgi:ABC-type multidrug transport system fused ATPase/permease subunit
VKYLKASLLLLPETSRRKFWYLTSIKSAVGLLDVVALGFVGLIGQLALAKSNDNDLAGLSEELIREITFGTTSTNRQFMVLTSWVLFFFVGKAVFSYLSNSKMFGFLAQEEINCGRRLAIGVFSASLVETKKKSSQQVSQVVTQGTIAAIPRVLGFSSVVVAEGVLIALLGILFLILEPGLSVVLALYFILLGTAMHLVIARPLENYGKTVAKTTSDSFRTIQEGIRTFREIFVLNRADYFVRRFIKSKREAAERTAHVLTLTTAPRHIVDTALIVGIALVGAVTFARNDPGEAARSISFVLIAGTRIAPSLLAIQGALAAIRQAGGESEGVYEMANTSNYDLSETGKINSESSISNIEKIMAPGVSVEIDNFSFTYPNRDAPALRNVTLSIPAGSLVGVSGESGSGKSTFVDAILGVIEGTGKIEISGLKPSDFLARFPGNLGYVPQETVLIEGTIAENIAFGCTGTTIDHQLVEECLQKVGLQSLVATYPEGTSTQVGEFGGFLSGGQKQRIGIARALYTNPALLVLDESTSALDIDSANVIRQLIDELRRTITVIVISHQSDFVSNCDLGLKFHGGVLTKHTQIWLSGEPENSSSTAT